MELFIGLVVAAVVVYFVFFRKANEVATPAVTVADVVAKAEVVEAAPAPAKKPAAKKAKKK